MQLSKLEKKVITDFQNQTKNTFIYSVKPDFLTNESMRNCSPVQPAPSVHYMNCNIVGFESGNGNGGLGKPSNVNCTDQGNNGLLVGKEHLGISSSFS